MPVIDSSTLISLAKIGGLEVLRLIKGTVITIPEVFQECVEQGIAVGQPDALKIKSVFDQNIISVEKAKKQQVFSGISIVDSMVLSLAKEKRGYLFSDDGKVSGRARAEGIEARNTPDMLCHLMVTRRISLEDYNKFFQKLVEKNRLSKKAMARYSHEGGHNGKGSKN